MKKVFGVIMVIVSLILTGGAYSQGFVETIEEGGFAAMYGNECVVTLQSGEEITGRFAGGVYVNNGLTRLKVKSESGENVKFTPEQVVSLKVKVSDLMKLSMISDAGSSIKEFANSDLNSIVERGWVIFETATTPGQKEAKRVLQLLNPGFDTKIKVFAEPGAKTGGLSIGGLQVTGGEDRVYLFVKGGAQAFKVKKGSYRDNFQELYSDCPQMLEYFQGEKIRWDDVALHVFTYDQLCK
ncbi:MAG: hypothetical protein MUE37_01895 [Bacteroidales bacterium]|jgi:hypothetical protein|nr:hypothetical protein [Bacteroidales bacterium]